MRKSYLKEHRPVLYTNLLLSGKLWDHLVEIDRACEERVEIIIKQIKAREGVTEALKADNQMEWIRKMSNTQNRAEEIVLVEIVYR